MSEAGAFDVLLSPPAVGETERAFLLAAFDSGWIAPAGPELDSFEAELADCVDVPHAVAVASGTAALHLALRVLGVGPGDQVLVSDLTFVASANVVLYVGAEPVFIDSDAATWNMDPTLLGEELEERARRGRLPAAVVVVDLYGQCADYEPISELCAAHRVPVVEDAAEALGATYRQHPAGSLGDLGAFSFNGNKIITAGGGGMLVSRQQQWINHARHLATQAREPAAHYEHFEVGHNYRMSSLLAAVGRAQLRSLPQRVGQRRAVRDRYIDALGEVDGLAFMPQAPYGESSAWLTVITIDEAAFGASPGDVRLHLARHGIEVRAAWKPMHLQPLYANAVTCGGAVSERIFATGLCLPSGSNLSQGEQAKVTELLLTTPRADIAMAAIATLNLQPVRAIITLARQRERTSR